MPNSGFSNHCLMTRTRDENIAQSDPYGTPLGTSNSMAKALVPSVVRSHSTEAVGSSFCATTQTSYSTGLSLIASSQAASPIISNVVASSQMVSPMMSSIVMSSQAASPMISSVVASSQTVSPMMSSIVMSSQAASPMISNVITSSQTVSRMMSNIVTSSQIVSPMISNTIASSQTVYPMISSFVMSSQAMSSIMHNVSVGMTESLVGRCFTAVQALATATSFDVNSPIFLPRPKSNADLRDWIWSEAALNFRTDTAWYDQLTHSAHDWFSQKKFWKFYSYLDERFSNNGSRYFELGSEDVDLYEPILAPSHWVSTDGLELSARNIRSILHYALRELEIREDVMSSHEIAALLHETLTKGISERAWRRIVSKESIGGRVESSVRDRVMNLSIHTGTSPPAVAHKRPAAGWAFVLFTNSQQVKDETVQRQTHYRNLSNALRGRRGISCLGRRSRNNTCLGRGAWSARCQRFGTNLSLAKCA
jgi:hypothetical protein